jgi:hypothetical protein
MKPESAAKALERAKMDARILLISKAKPATLENLLPFVPDEITALIAGIRSADVETTPIRKVGKRSSGKTVHKVNCISEHKPNFLEEDEFTVRVGIAGQRNGTPTGRTYDLIDYVDPVSGKIVSDTPRRIARIIDRSKPLTKALRVWEKETDEE